MPEILLAQRFIGLTVIGPNRTGSPHKLPNHLTTNSILWYPLAQTNDTPSE